MTEVTQEKLNAFVGKMLGDLGGAFSVPTTRIGFRLGLFDALHRHGPATSKELAARSSNGLAERYVREWAMARAANGYVTRLHAHPSRDPGTIQHGDRGSALGSDTPKPVITLLGLTPTAWQPPLSAPR